MSCGLCLWCASLFYKMEMFTVLRLEGGWGKRVDTLSQSPKEFFLRCSLFLNHRNKTENFIWLFGYSLDCMYGTWPWEIMLGPKLWILQSPEEDHMGRKDSHCDFSTTIIPFELFSVTKGKRYGTHIFPPQKQKAVKGEGKFKLGRNSMGNEWF